jgi:TPR repeat protein
LNEAAVYLAFMEIYGARESDFKDLEKAKEYYQSAMRLGVKNDPAKAISLNLDAVEIDWQQKGSKEADSLAKEALAYYEKNKDDRGSSEKFPYPADQVLPAGLGNHS